MKLVLVEWMDSCLGGSQWMPLKVIAEDNEPVLCRTVGWLVAEGPKAKTLVSSISGEAQGATLHAQGGMIIPNKCILKLRVLASNSRPG